MLLGLAVMHCTAAEWGFAAVHCTSCAPAAHMMLLQACNLPAGNMRPGRLHLVACLPCRVTAFSQASMDSTSSDLVACAVGLGGHHTTTTVRAAGSSTDQLPTTQHVHEQHRPVDAPGSGSGCMASRAGSGATCTSKGHEAGSAITGLLQLPDGVIQCIIQMLDEGSCAKLLAASKQTAVLVFQSFKHISCHVDLPAHIQSQPKFLHWATAACPGLHMRLGLSFDDSIIDSDLVPGTLSSVWAGDCLPMLTKLALYGVRIDSLLPDSVVAALPNLQQLNYTFSKFSQQLQPICTSAAVRLQHLSLQFLDPGKVWDDDLEGWVTDDRWRECEEQHMQQLCQLSTLTSLTIQCGTVTLPRFVYDMAGQLTSLSLLCTPRGAARDYSAAITELLPLCKQLQQLHLDYRLLGIGALHKLSDLPLLTQLHLSEVDVSGEATMQLLSMSQLTSLHARKLDLCAAAPSSCGLRSLKVEEVTLQQLSYMPLQQLTEPLQLTTLVISCEDLQEQLQYAATAIQRLLAGPGRTVGVQGRCCCLKQAAQQQHVTPEAVAQLLQACGPLLPAVSKTSLAYNLVGLHISAPIVWALRRLLRVNQPGVHDMAVFEFDACVFAENAWCALAKAFPGLQKLSLDFTPSVESMWEYVLVADKQRTVLQRKLDIVNKSRLPHTDFIAQLQDRLEKTEMSWITHYSGF